VKVTSRSCRDHRATRRKPRPHVNLRVLFENAGRLKMHCGFKGTSFQMCRDCGDCIMLL
jgi:hypothetical protein